MKIENSVTEIFELTWNSPSYKIANRRLKNIKFAVAYPNKGNSRAEPRGVDNYIQITRKNSPAVPRNNRISPLSKLEKFLRCASNNSPEENAFRLHCFSHTEAFG